MSDQPRAIDIALDRIIATSLEDAEAREERTQRSKATTAVLQSATESVTVKVAAERQKLLERSTKSLMELANSGLDKDTQDLVKQIHTKIWGTMLGTEVTLPGSTPAPKPGQQSNP